MSVRPEDRVREEAARLGFDACRIAPAGLPARAGDRLGEWLADGRHGDMEWMAERREERGSPDRLWPEARSAIVLAVSYAPDHDPLADLAQRAAGNISIYARRRDYHEAMRGRLKMLGQKLHPARARPRHSFKVFVDTAPVLEKPLAEQAGLGWQGKHTVLVSRHHGNWLFLGVLLTTLGLEPDTPGKDHCGSCRRCLDICPTRAFPAPYQLDSRLCISYLTIEHAGPVPRHLRPLFGNRIFGCDDCLAICPWNRFAGAANAMLASSGAGLPLPPLSLLLSLDDAAFRRMFAGSPVKRGGRDRFLRNVLIAAGNSGEPALLPSILPLLDDPATIVRGAAVWALRRLAPPETSGQMRVAREASEPDPEVRAEWRGAV